MKEITLNNFKSLFRDSQQVRIELENGFLLQTFAKIEEVSIWSENYEHTTKVRFDLDNLTHFEIQSKNIMNIFHYDTLTVNNTNVIEINTKDLQTIVIEFEV